MKLVLLAMLIMNGIIAFTGYQAGILAREMSENVQKPTPTTTAGDPTICGVRTYMLQVVVDVVDGKGIKGERQVMVPVYCFAEPQ